QKAANTELTIQKLNDAFKAQWRAVIDQATIEPIPDNILYGDRNMQGLLAMASNPINPGDPDAMHRARVIWIKLRLKQQFPMNFMEALNPTPPTIRSAANVLPFVVLPPAPVFAQSLPATPLAATLPALHESSVCLLLTLSQNRKGVVGFDQDRLAATEKSTVNGLKAIIDGWGKPLAFYRWPIGGEVEASNPNLTAT